MHEIGRRNPWECENFASTSKLSQLESFVQDHIKSRSPQLCCKSKLQPNLHFPSLQNLQNSRRRVDEKSWKLENLKSEHSIRDILGGEVINYRLALIQDMKKTIGKILDDQEALKVLDILHRPLAGSSLRVSEEEEARALLKLLKRMPRAPESVEEQGSILEFACQFLQNSDGMEDRNRICQLISRSISTSLHHQQNFKNLLAAQESFRTAVGTL